MEHAITDHNTTTLPQALTASAQRVPGRGIAILDRRGQNAERRTYPQILDMARTGAARLAAAGIAAGDRLLLCLPTSWDLLEVYFGAIWRGAHPILVAPPGALGVAETHARRIGALIQLLQPKRFVCDDATRKELLRFDVKDAATLSLTPGEIAAQTPAAVVAQPAAQAGDVAFMQLTSGSTGRQRAVMIRHSSVIHNAGAMARFVNAAPFAPDEIVVSWLPLNHDMGLVGCLFYSMVNGFDLWLLRPDAFLARPRLWLQTLSAHRGVRSPGPNFAYQLCVERLQPADIEGLDLSSWKSALTGAEMVHPVTCRAFCEKFAQYGFNPASLVPSYGMAEATLAAAADQQHRGVRTAKMPQGQSSDSGLNEIVCVGAPVCDTEIRVSVPTSPGEFLPDERIGEVWINGPGVFAGYYNDAAATADTLRSADGRQGWLRTGDLGFTKNGELYLTGRIKDLLIIRGHNLMPHELEWIAEQASGGGGTERCGAFSVTKGNEGEQAVLVLEVGGTDVAALAALGHEIRSRVGTALGLPLADLVLVKRGQIPKTTSGKVQRHELRQRYLDGTLTRVTS
jgi:fatty-acyl-CoA synthase